MDAEVARRPVGGETTTNEEQHETNQKPAQIANSSQDNLASQHDMTIDTDGPNKLDDEKKTETGDQLNDNEGAREKLLPAQEETVQDRIDDDGFVLIDPENSYRLEKHKASFFTQMEKYLVNQVALCSFYKGFYEDQKNGTLVNLFSTHLSNSNRDLDLLRIAMKNNDSLPKYKLETVSFNAVPVNVDVNEKELQLVIRTTKLPMSENAQIYAIGEFSFTLSDQPMSSTISRWFHHVKVEPKNLVCCSIDASRQLDIVYSTDRKPFTNPSSEWLEFDRPMLFNVQKGKSRTHKRKFKPIKLTFYERTNLLKCDQKIGTVQLKVDSINDEARISTKQVIMNGRKDTGAFADIQIKVWKPLVENTIRAHEEKLLILS